MKQYVGKQFAHYQLNAMLGEGGMGVVYHAHDLQASRPVAVKIMLANLTNRPLFRQRFDQEAQAVASFRNPAIIKMYDKGHFEDTPYMAMEYVEGGSLTNYLKQLQWSSKRMPLQDLVTVGAQIMEGLAYAHQRGIIHRDIKPDNILLKLRDGNNGAIQQAVISDFGLAIMQKKGDELATNPFMGSLAYMSPEQCQNLPFDGRSDIYSAGIMLYQIATGQLPFQIKAPVDIIKHVEEPPIPPNLINPELPQAVEDIILKAIAKRPSERFQTAAEMARELRRVSNDEALLTAVPHQQRSNEVTRWLGSKWVADVNVQSRVEMNKTWTTEGTFRLFVTNQYEDSKIHSLHKDEMTIGRHPSNDIVLPDQAISARHVSLKRTMMGWQVRDLGSTNGTYIGDRLLEFDQEINWTHHEVLRIGPYFLKWQLFSDGRGKGQSPAAIASPVPSSPEPSSQNNGQSNGRTNGYAALPLATMGTAVSPPSPSPPQVSTPSEPFEPINITGSKSEALKVAVSPNSIELEPEIGIPVDITITNRDTIVKDITVGLFDENGRHPHWVALLQRTQKLLPGETTVIPATINLPEDNNLLAGDHPLNVQVTTDKGETAVTPIRLIMSPDEDFTLDLHPRNLKEGVICRVAINDRSNVATEYTVIGKDDADVLSFDFQPPLNATVSGDFDMPHQQRLKLNPGANAQASFTIGPQKRPWFGRSQMHPFKVQVYTQDDSESEFLSGQVTINPRISRGVLIFFIIFSLILGAIGYFVYARIQEQHQQKLDEALAESNAILAAAEAELQAAEARKRAAEADLEAAEAELSAAVESGDEQAIEEAEQAVQEAEQAVQEAEQDVEQQEEVVEEAEQAVQAVLEEAEVVNSAPTDITLDVTEIEENSDIGTEVGTFTASDPDVASNFSGGAVAQVDLHFLNLTATQELAPNTVAAVSAKSSIQSKLRRQVGTFTYSLVSGTGSDDNDAFTIEGDTLLTAAVFDFETQTTYKIRVEVDDTFGGTFQKQFTIEVTDLDDTPELTIEPKISANEDDGEATVTVSLEGENNATVTVEYTLSADSASSGKDYTNKTGTLTWEAGETDPVTFKIDIKNDSIDEEDETFTVTFSNVQNATMPNTTSTITIVDDDDLPTLSVSDVDVDEFDNTVRIEVKLTGSSSSNVSVAYATSDSGKAKAGDDYESKSETLTWSAEQTGVIAFDVTIKDDEIFEPDEESFTITLSSPQNATLGKSTAIVKIIDDDMPIISISTDSTVDEQADGTVVVTFSISGESNSEIKVDYATSNESATSGDKKDYIAHPKTTLTWSALDTEDKTINVTINNDAIDESDETFKIELSNPVNAKIDSDSLVTVITIKDDNDEAGVSVDETSINVNEVKTPVAGDKDTYDIVLMSEPESDVTITLTDDSQLSFSPNSITFTPLNWSASQEITVSAKNDDIDEGDDKNKRTIKHTATSSDDKYDGISIANVGVTIDDSDDTAGIIISQNTAIDINEGAQATYTIVLNSEPEANVKIRFTHSDLLEPITPNPITFTSINWKTSQEITVIAKNNAIDEGSRAGTIEHTAESSDGNYNGTGATFAPNPAIVNVNINDPEDIAGVTLSENTTNSIDINEGGEPITYTVVLDSQPEGNVTIDIAPGATSTANKIALMDENQTTSINQLNFTTSNWNQPQIVTVKANEDADAQNHDGITITHRINISTPYLRYEADGSSSTPTIANVTVNVKDDETPTEYAIIIEPTTINIREGDDPVIVTVSLTFPTPGETVNTDLNIVFDNSHDTDQLDVIPNTQAGDNPNTVRFTSGNSDPETFTVAADKDFFDEENIHTYIITLTKEAHPSNNFTSAVVPTITVNITDTDTAGVTITPTNSIVITEGVGVGFTGTYTVVLESKPRADVTITFTPTNQIEPISAITFTPDGPQDLWNVPQEITITAVDDDVDEESPHTGIITYTYASAVDEPHYNSTMPITFTIDIDDNDTAGVTITETNGTTTAIEGNTTSYDTYDIVLNSEPEGDETVIVTIAFNPSIADKIKLFTGSPSVEVTKVTFIKSDWYIPQTVSVQAVEDSGNVNETVVIAHTVTSSNTNDPLYNGAGVAFTPSENVSVDITDND